MAKKRGRPKKGPDMRELLDEYLPASDIFDEAESTMYNGLVKVYLDGFDGNSELTAYDMDDIMSLAMNRVLELRLLKNSKDSPSKQISVSSAIERFRKQNEKLKENLLARRKDRIDPKKYGGVTIVDIAAMFDEEKKRKMMGKSSSLMDEEREIVDSGMLIGNKNDSDAVA